MLNDVVNADELAKKLGVTAGAIRNWHRDGLIPYMRAGRRTVRYSFEKVVAALEKRATGQGGTNAK